MKPGDLYLGAVDFFSTLVPGGIAVLLLVLASAQHDVLQVPAALGQWMQKSSLERWVVLLVFAYLMGHLIAAVGTAVLDPVYKRTYARWRSATAKYAKSRLSPSPSRLAVIRARVGHVWKKTNPDDELLAAAKMLKRQQLREVARAAGVCSEDITDTFWWAGTVVRMKSRDGATEIDALLAQSKLFRGVVVVAVLGALWPGFELALVGSSWVWITALLVALILGVFGAWRFMHLRWGATERTYEYFIALSVLPATPESAAVLADASSKE